MTPTYEYYLLDFDNLYNLTAPNIINKIIATVPNKKYKLVYWHIDF